MKTGWNELEHGKTRVDIEIEVVPEDRPTEFECADDAATKLYMAAPEGEPLGGDTEPSAAMPRLARGTTPQPSLAVGTASGSSPKNSALPPIPEVAVSTENTGAESLDNLLDSIASTRREAAQRAFGDLLDSRRLGESVHDTSRRAGAAFAASWVGLTSTAILAGFLLALAHGTSPFLWAALSSLSFLAVWVGSHATRALLRRVASPGWYPHGAWLGVVIGGGAVLVWTMRLLAPQLGHAGGIGGGFSATWASLGALDLVMFAGIFTVEILLLTIGSWRARFAGYQRGYQ